MGRCSRQAVHESKDGLRRAVVHDPEESSHGTEDLCIKDSVIDLDLNP